jgi:hypothetical protein
MAARWEALQSQFEAQAGPKPAANAKKKGKKKAE